MSNRRTHAENLAWHNSLPAKHLSASVLCWNIHGELLLVIPSYDNSWLLPGGVVEENESPLDAAIREAEEELGLKFERKRLHFVGINYAHTHAEWHDFVHFFFSAGVLTEHEIQQMGKKARTVHGYQFMSRKQLPDHVASHRLKAIDELFDEGTRQGFYLESKLDKHHTIE